MDFFHVNNNDSQELSLDKLMGKIEGLFSKRGDELETSFKLGKKNKVDINFSTKRIEDVYLTKYKLVLNADVAVNNNEGIQNIGLYFRKNCNPSHATLNKNNVDKYLKPQQLCLIHARRY